IRQAFAGIPPGPTPPRVRVREPQQEGERRVLLRRPGGATAYLHIAFHVPSASHQDLAALLVADGLLSGFKSFVPFDQGGGGRSSRLYRALVDRGLASDAGTALTPGADPTLFRVTVTARAGVDPARVERPTPRSLLLVAAPGATPGAADHPTDRRPHRTAKRHGRARQGDAGDRPGRGARVHQGRRHVRWHAQRAGALCRRDAAAGNPPGLLAGTGR